MAKKKEETVVEETTEQPKVDNTVEKIKVKKKPTMKKLNQDEEVIKVDLSKPVEETKVEEVVSEETPVEEVVEETPVEKIEEETPIVEEITDEEVKEQVEEITEQVEEAITEAEATGKPIPENIQKLMDFMEDTGGNLEDYVKLNKDYSKLEDDTLLKEYYSQTKPHLSKEEINFLIDDKYQVDEEIDEEKDIRRKNLAYKEAIAEAKQDLEKLKSKYYAEIQNRPGVNKDQQKAVDFFNRYNKQQEVAQGAQKDFKHKTDELFSTDFKGFDYKVGEKQFRYKVQEPKSTAQKQTDINTFISQYLDKDGKVQDASGYHKALHAAMNADKLAQHFYEQGKADGVKDIIKQSKNPATETPRQVASGDVYVGGIKVKSISGADSSKLKIRKRKFNN